MKNLIFALSFLFCKNLFSQGITFETEWKTAVAKATKEKKLIFMYAYKTWYPDYQSYEKTVFLDSAVGRYFNDNFINLKCNAEKDWGLKAAKHYQISGFPTLVFIHPESLEIYYWVANYGTKNPNELKEEGIIANRERNAPPSVI